MSLQETIGVHTDAGRPDSVRDTVALTDIDAVVDEVRTELYDARQGDGHWVFELEADATIPAEYILYRHFLGDPASDEIERKIGNYLRRIQNDEGGWPLFHAGDFNMSASVKAYYALKVIGETSTRRTW